MTGRHLLAAALALACAPHPPAAAPPAAPAADAPIVDAPRRRGKPAILIAMPNAAAFRAVRGALLKEVKRDFDIVTLIVDGQTAQSDFSARVERIAPACSVVMDGSAVKLYRPYQKSRPAGSGTAPVVVMMSSSFDETGAELDNASGVAQEIPAVTSLVNLRSVIQRPVARVGVLHRPGFRRFLDRQKALAATEQITLVPVEVPEAPGPADIRKALQSLSGSIDALWVLSDKELLKDERFLDQGWRPELAALRVPVVVGLPALVGAEARFGTLAVLPDLEALGVQAANLVYDIAESDWHADDHPVELPISTVTVVNMRQVRQFGLREGAAQRIDRAVE
jgi:putative ABC transport system substrate-binding protein